MATSIHRLLAYNLTEANYLGLHTSQVHFKDRVPLSNPNQTACRDSESRLPFELEPDAIKSG